MFVLRHLQYCTYWYFRRFSESGVLWITSQFKEVTFIPEDQVTRIYEKVLLADLTERNWEIVEINRARDDSKTVAEHHLKLRESGNITSFSYTFLKTTQRVPTFFRENLS